MLNSIGISDIDRFCFSPTRNNTRNLSAVTESQKLTKIC